MKTISCPAKEKTTLVLLLVVLLGPFLAISAPAQQYASQDGRFLDANPRIGSMGINPEARLDSLIPRVNMYITGNVTGGASFQGLIPYSSVYEFGGTLGSSSLSNFRRDSVSVGTLNTQLTGPQPYIDPSRSVATYYGGRVVNTGQLYQPLPSYAAPSADSQAQQSTDIRIRPRSSLDLTIPMRSYGGAANLFPYSYGAAGLPARTAEMPQSLPPGFSPYELTQQPDQAATFNPDEQQFPLEEISTGQPDDFTMQSLRRPVRSQPDQPATSETPRWSQTPGIAGPSETAPAYDTEPDETISDEEGARSEQAQGTPTAPVDVERVQSAAHLQQQLADQDYSRYLRRGQRLLEDGDFYRAADAFSAASIYKMNGAHAYLGKANALFGAGEYMSASFYLDRALRLSPDLAAEPVDLPAFFSEPARFQEALAELTDWSQRTGRWELAFLRAYVLANSGDKDTARQLLSGILRDQSDLPAPRVLQQAIAAEGNPS